MEIEDMKHQVASAIQAPKKCPPDKKPISLMTIDELAEVLPIIRAPKRRCASCGLDKDESEYYSYRRSGRLYVRKTCKECHKACYREYYNLHKNGVKNAKSIWKTD